MNLKPVRVLGITFYNGDAVGAVGRIKSGGLLVAPSGPGLATVDENRVYYESLLTADVVIPDSGYMVSIWNILQRSKIKRISGLEFLIALLEDKEVGLNSSLLLVDPNSEEAAANLEYLVSIGINTNERSSYIAPMYDKNNIQDSRLLDLIEDRRPRYVMINLGGGVQEILGAYLKRKLSYAPAIICTGAAIAFLTGKQAHIPNWADRIFLGWLLRIIEKPKVYAPRYFKAFRLLTIMLRYGAHSPWGELNAEPQTRESR
jgi:N-acetylglucosaminyldiphosphoundecaprenol N-acetyl-beta-D-mannosaminyltransferase